MKASERCKNNARHHVTVVKSGTVLTLHCDDVAIMC